MSLYIPEINSEKPEPRCGHICFYRRGNIFIWSGFNGDFEHLPGLSLWVYNVSTCIWRDVHCTGNRDIPNGSSGASAACVGQTIYVFGGHSFGVGHCNDLFSLNLETYSWKNLTMSVKGQVPLPRDKFGCWTFENRLIHRIIYFGGYGPRPATRFIGTFVLHENSMGWNDQVVVLQINSDGSLEWQYPNAKGDAPQPRAAHGMAKIGNKGYLFGGRHSVCRDNDLHCFDLENYEWSGRLRTTGPEPCGRSWHIFVCCGTNHLLLFGGFDAMENELGDAWLLNVCSLTWIQIDTFNHLSSPITRLWHTACQTKTEGEVAIFGGCSGSPFGPVIDHRNELIFFHFSPQKLQRLCEEFIVKNMKTLPYKVISILPRQLSRTLAVRLNISQEDEDYLV